MEYKCAAEKLPFGKKLIYALGQFGWSLASYGVLNLINYFYYPPVDSGERVFPVFVYTGAVMGFATLVGLIAFGGRVFDAVTDPLIAGWTDRSHSKFGRRRKFLLISGVPFAVLSLLVFTPPVAGEANANVVWLMCMVFAFYLFMTMYVTPFFALLSELGHNSEERLTLSTLISITWALGFAVGSQVYLFKDIAEQSVKAIQFPMLPLSGYFVPIIEAENVMTSVTAFQIVIGIFALVGMIFMYLPVIFIDERRYCEIRTSNEGSFQAVVSAFKNKNFRRFTFSDLTYWLALTFIQAGLIYYVVTLLKLPESINSQLLIVMFALSFAFYVPINLVAKKIGKKKVTVFAFIVFILTFATVIVLGKLPIPEKAQAYIMVCIAAIPIAIFGILPNAITADIAEADGRMTGNYKAGIFFGARTFMQKMGISLSNLLFPSLLLIGQSGLINNVGIRLTGAAAMLFCILGLVFFLGYDEKEIQRILSEEHQPDLTDTPGIAPDV